jgi:hypothetical protein
MASSRLPNSAVHRTRVKQRGIHVKPEVATVSFARGVFRGERRARIDTEQEQSNAGELPKTLMSCGSIHRYHACTWTHTFVHTTLSISRSTVSLRDLLCFKIQTCMHAFLSFFSHCTTLERSNILFSIFRSRRLWSSLHGMGWIGAISQVTLN